MSGGVHLTVVGGETTAGGPNRKRGDSLVEYHEYLTALGLRPRTVRAYELRVAAAERWARARGLDLLALKPTEAAELATLVPNTNPSRRQLRSALTHYWDLHDVHGYYKAITVPPRPPARWKGLEEPQVKRLLAAARGDWPRGGVVYLGLYLGLRREEIAALRWKAFDADFDWVTIVGKGDRTRHLPVHPRLSEMLGGARWPGEWVFPGRMGGHISLTTINNWIGAVGEEAGLGHLHPHQLRHTAGAHINDITRDIHAAQEWLGHVRVETTQVYTRVTDQRKLEAMRTMDSWESDADGVAA